MTQPQPENPTRQALRALACYPTARAETVLEEPGELAETRAMLRSTIDRLAPPDLLALALIAERLALGR